MHYTSEINFQLGSIGVEEVDCSTLNLSYVSFFFLNGQNFLDLSKKKLYLFNVEASYHVVINFINFFKRKSLNVHA